MDKTEKGPFNPQFVFALVCSTLFLSTYYIMMPVLPLYMKGMGGNNFEIGLIMGVFSVFSLVLRPISGKLCDSRNPVMLLRVSILFFFITPICFIIPSFALVGLAQGVYGFTIGMFTTASGVVVTASVREELISQAIGFHSVALILAKGMAPTLGSSLYAWAGARAAITATVALALAALFCTWFLKPANIAREKKQSSVSVMKVFTREAVWMPSLILFSITITFGAIMTMLPLFAQERGIEQFNLFFTLNTAVVVFVRVAVSHGKLSRNAQIFSSLAALCVAVCVLAFCNSLPLLFITALIYGYGYGLSYPALTSIVMIKNDPAVRGTAFGVFTAFFDVGVACGAAFGGLSEYLGFTVIYGLVACTPALGAIIFYFFSKRQLRTEQNI